MVVETRYVAGRGLLLGSGNHWLLLTDPGDESVVEELWTALGTPDPAERVQEIAERAFSGEVPGLVLVDLGPGSAPHVVLGTGSVQVRGSARFLTLDAPATGPSRRIIGGIVAADSAEVRRLAPQAAPNVPGQAAPPPPAEGLIDGIPQAILAAKGPDGPPPPRPRPRRPDPADSTSRDTTEPDPELMERITDAAPPQVHSEAAPESGSEVGHDAGTEAGTEAGHEVGTDTGDHDGSTVFRPEHLVAASSGESVQAVWCPAGHPTPPNQPLCRVCRSQVAPQHPQRVQRPVLGGLRLPTGEVVPLDRGVVLGRRPQPIAGDGEWPHLVTLSSEHTFVSRLHLHLSLEGWQVIARDLGSRGGTTLKVPGQAPVRLVPEQPYLIEPGHALDLADTYEIRYEVGPDAGALPGPTGSTT